MDTLLLRWIDDEHAAWRLAGVSGRGSLADAAPLARGRRVLLLVPGEDVLLASAAMPSRKPAEIARALPYALEEWLLEPPETQHFAWQRTATGVAAAIVARTAIEHWLAQLGEAGIEPDLLLPDTLALPWTAGRWSLFCESGEADARVLVRSGLRDGLACTRASLPLVLAALLQRTPDAERPAGIDVWGAGESAGGGTPSADPADSDRGIDALAADLRLPIARQRASAALLDLADAFALPADLNLLQGTYAPRRAQARRNGPRRALAIAAALWLVSAFAYAGVHAAVLARESRVLQGAIDTVFRDAVPGEHRIVDARAQLQQALSAAELGRGTDGPIDLLAAVADARLDATGVRLQRIEYRDGRLDLLLQAPRAAGLEAAQHALAAQGLNAELRDVGSDGGHAQGRTRIAGAAR
jgi:general secretion pathway protein L